MPQASPGASGRTGLALSGGGFRASFYHVGVLARLADAGLLPKVQVVSSVSGGSITAAVYGLHLRRLLEAGVPDAHAAAVRATWETLRDGVRSNLRGRMFGNLWHTLRMLTPIFTRSERLAMLYDKHLLRPAAALEVGRRKQSLRMPMLGPPSEKADQFPEFLINATVLNTGHGWQFTPTTMGESPREGEVRDAAGRRREARTWANVDKNTRLCPPDDYSQTPFKEGFPLESAVAASTAVPGVFAPVPISGMYAGMRLQLVDGGVQDNIGIQALVGAECDRFIISGAGGQMGDQEYPSPAVGPSLGRTVSIARDRVRESSLYGPLQNGSTLMVHLLSGVPVRVRDALNEHGDATNCDPPKTPWTARDPDHKRCLAAIRTDLDVFSDIEMQALADDAYRAVGNALVATKDQGWDADAGRTTDWPWKGFRDAHMEARKEAAWHGEGADGAERKNRIDRVLEAGKHGLGRPLRVGNPFLRVGVAAWYVICMALGLVPILGALLLAWRFWPDQFALNVVLAGVALFAALVEFLWRKDYAEWVRKFAKITTWHRWVPVVLFAIGAFLFTRTYVPAAAWAVRRTGRLAEFPPSS